MFWIEKALRKRQKVCAVLIAKSYGPGLTTSIAQNKNGFYFGVSYAPSQPRALTYGMYVVATQVCVPHWLYRMKGGG